MRTTKKLIVSGIIVSLFTMMYADIPKNKKLILNLIKSKILKTLLIIKCKSH